MYVNRFGAIRGYHIYLKSWKPKLSEILEVKIEKNNLYDKYALAVLSGDLVIGHIPREISQLVWWFLESGGTLQVEILDTHRRPSPLAQHGLEILSAFHFFGPQKRLGKISAEIDLQMKDYQSELIEYV